MVIEHGYDGFTMDDLAVAVGVSRRTLFNYIPDKPSAVLGWLPQADDPALVSFIEGKPTGKPVADLTVALEALVAEAVCADFSLADHLDQHRLIDEAIASDPKVAALALERFTQISDLLAGAMRQREGWDSSDLRARVFAETVAALIKATLDEMTTTGNPDFPATFRRVLDADRAVRALSD